MPPFLSVTIVLTQLGTVCALFDTMIASGCLFQLLHLDQVSWINFRFLQCLLLVCWSLLTCLETLSK